MPHSMTSFARQEAGTDWGQLQCEIKSVNHRYLEPSFKLADPLRGLEPPLRERLRQRLGRGKLEVVLNLRTESIPSLPPLDIAMAREILARVSELEQLSAPLAPVDPLALLKWPGLLQSDALDQAALDQAALALFDRTLAMHLQLRAREGASLAQLIEDRLATIAAELATLRPRLPELIALQQAKLEQRLNQLHVEVDRDRLAQELVYLAQRADVAEEFDRLETHLAEVSRTLRQDGPVGRRLDFLMQELNREANTLGSKSLSTEMTRAAVDIKVLIEQMREQIQNLE